MLRSLLGDAKLLSAFVQDANLLNAFLHLNSIPTFLVTVGTTEVNTLLFCRWLNLLQMGVSKRH